MIWDGRDVLVLWKYKPQTKLSLKWSQRADTNWRGCDRSTDEDVYGADVTFRGPIDELTDLELVLAQRRADFIINCNSGEEIFGADVDHSGDVKVIVTNYGKIRHVSFKVYEMSLSLRMVETSFLNVVASLDSLRTLGHVDTRETAFEMNKLFTYDQDIYIQDHLSQDGTEAGTYQARFNQDRDEMAAIRRYLSTTARAKKIPFPTFGNILYPFGTRAGLGPFNCRIIRWDDLGRQGFCDWNLSITFARDIAYWNE